MSAKLMIGVIFGGKTVEHEVSLVSAKSVMEAIDKEKFDVVPIGVSKSGRWLSPSDSMKLLHGEAVVQKDLHLIIMGSNEFRGLIKVKDPGSVENIPEDMKHVKNHEECSGYVSKVDVLFPLIHGSYGEDGKLQGMLEMADIPYVGSGHLSSALGIDKDMMKRLLRENGIPVPDYRVIYWGQWEKDKESILKYLLEIFEFPLFIKPAHTGSSVGISKVKNIEMIRQAIQEAFRYDDKVIIEKAIHAREIECSVLGNDEPMASIPGEVIPCNEFYDYNAKYIDDSSELIIPVKLSEGMVKDIQDFSIRAFKTLECSGMARVDLFLENETNHLYVNELNTIPGFTPISMYPKLLEASGISFQDLITRLINLALERYKQRSRLETSYKVGVD